MSALLTQAGEAVGRPLTPADPSGFCREVVIQRQAHARFPLVPYGGMLAARKL